MNTMSSYAQVVSGPVQLYSAESWPKTPIISFEHDVYMCVTGPMNSPLFEQILPTFFM